MIKNSKIIIFSNFLLNFLKENFHDFVEFSRSGIKINATKPLLRTFSIFQSVPEVFHLNVTEFSNKNFNLNFSHSSGDPNRADSTLDIRMRVVDYESGVKVTIFVSCVILLVQAYGTLYNLIQICRDQTKVDLTISSVILFYANSNVALHLVSVRLFSINSSFFDFISFSTYYAQCLLIGMYIAIIKTRIRAGTSVCYNELLVLTAFVVLSVIYKYCFEEPLEGYVMFMYILPVAYQCYVSFREAKLVFSVGYTFIFKFSQISLLLFLSFLEAPYSLMPPNKGIVSGSLLGVGFVYSVVLAQYQYHPKLFMRYKHLQECMKYRPVRKRVGDLPPKEDGYTCVICMTEFVKDDEVGVLTHCGHFFHEECLEEWLKIKKSCPICKSHCLPMNPKND